MLVRLGKKVAALSYTIRSTASSLVTKEDSLPHPSPVPRFADWRERDDIIVWNRRHDLDLEATTWIQTCTLDDDLRSSLVSIIPDLQPDRAILLVFSMLASRLHLSTPTLMNRVQERSCSELLRDAGMRFSKRSRTRTCDMLLKLLECVPPHNDPSKLGALDLLWTIWEFCLGACFAQDQDTLLYQSVLNGVAALLSEGNPFRLRRAALNILYESTHAWTFLYCPAAIGNVITFARACYHHQTPDIFLKASAVALHLSARLNWDLPYNETRAFHRPQLQALLRDLSRFLIQCNEDGVRHEERSANKLVYGLALLAEKDGELVGAILPDVLLEGVKLGLIDLSHEEHLRLRGMQEKWPQRGVRSWRR
ncbi:hypothetical protein L226DRAFT_463126 [Lentinus tigrinus ALCF2SS1-7]|uniref:uncharacterized protein n=1 Tax=Lentinus tigrinus ALCF2SS1-7 TaxID=1328758 RepID=UPI001165DBA9|nr:hypothetical protein L226DRAFT_463126 [Lentinus tigrinus ALCF2SS1-7]